MGYNTVPFHGKACQVEKGGVVTDYGKGFSLAIQIDMAEASRAGQSWKEALPGQGSWNGSFEVFYVPGNAQQKAFYDNIIAVTPGTLLTDVKFLLDTSTNAHTGDIYITAINFNGNIGGVVSATINYQGNGAPALTDAA